MLTEYDEGSPPPEKARPGTIKMPPKVYRPARPSTYVEPEGLPDPSEGLECLHQPLGPSLWKERDRPGKRVDIIPFQLKDKKQLDKNINWEGCMEEHRHRIKHMIEEYWDVFAEEGLRNPILGFQFVVDDKDFKN